MTTIEDVEAISQGKFVGRYGLTDTWVDLAEENWRESDIVQIDFCRAWLKDAPRRKTINQKVSSYGLKHRMERLYMEQNPGKCLYVSNGCFIIAALLEGLNMKRGDGPNAYFNLLLLGSIGSAA